MKTILVVDDEFGITEALSSTLTDEGYRVFTASNGKQGLAVAADVKPDLIIVDFMMPILSGSAMVEQLRNGEYDHVPVIVMSAVTEVDVRRQIDGYAAYLEKPFHLDQLLAQIQRLIGAP
jgi:DNA-binding response OmpR family regulator